MLKCIVKVQILYGALRYLSESTNCTIQEQMFIKQSCIICVLYSSLCSFRNIFPD